MIKVCVFLMKFCRKTIRKRVFYSFLVKICGFLVKKGTFQRVKGFVVGGPQLFASF